MLPTLTVLAMDVGGTSVKSALVRDGALLSEPRRTAIPSQGEAEEVLAAFRAIIDGYPQAEALALAFPGPFDYQSGVCRVQGLEKFGSLYGLDLAGALSGGRPIRFRNDAEAAIVGEARHGAGLGLSRLLGVTLGTGLGSAFLLDGTLQELQGGVTPILLDHKHPHAGFVASLDHVQAIMPARGHRLFGHHMAPGFRDFNRLRRMQATGRREHDEVRRGRLEHFGHAKVSIGKGPLDRLVERVAVNVANIDDFNMFGVLLHRREVIGRDSPASDKRHADLPAGDGGVVAHFFLLRAKYCEAGIRDGWDGGKKGMSAR